MTAQTLARTILISLAFVGCGIESPPPPATPTCDEYSFFVTAMKGPPLEGIDIKCSNQAMTDSDLYTKWVYKSGITIYYIANSKPLRVEGSDIPLCISDKYNQAVPAIKWGSADCKYIPIN